MLPLHMYFRRRVSAPPAPSWRFKIYYICYQQLCPTRTLFKCLSFFQGGDPIEFRLINDAYNRLISHVSRLEAIESEVEQSKTSVIIEISKQAVPKWKDKLKATYGSPKTSKISNTLFNVTTVLKDNTTECKTGIRGGSCNPSYWEVGI
jgi:hypothetical protein